MRLTTRVTTGSGVMGARVWRANARRADMSMVLDANLRTRLTEALRSVDDRGTTGPRLRDDAIRLWRRVQKLMAMGLVQVGDTGEREALELSCYALQLPMRRGGGRAGSRRGRSAMPLLRDRCEEAAESLVAEFG